MALDLTTLLVWTLRIVLPILFFAIYFRFQAPPKQQQYPGPTKNQLSRGKLLALRKAVADCPAPDSMKNIALKDQKQAPELFTGTGRAPRTERTRRAPDDARVPGERREKREREKREKKEQEPTPDAPSLSDDKMHLESLLNYVAFNSKEQQRTFLPDTSEGAPLPPKQKAEDKPGGSGEENGNRADKANDEAQMVLRGAMGIKRPDVAKTLYDQLMEAHVEISETTFELMIDICLEAKDLKGASDFLLKLENAGFSPNSDLLDKVLDLYSQQQSAPEQGYVAQAETLAGADSSLDAVLAEVEPAVVAGAGTNSAEATMAAWTQFNQAPMMPMFNWDAIDSGSGSESDEPGETHKLSSAAPEFVPSFISGPLSKTLEDASNSMSATAEPFEPQYNMSFDPDMYTWTSWDQPVGWGPPDEDRPYAADKGMDKGKGKSKGKGKTKWKGEWDDGWHSRATSGSRGGDDGWQTSSSGGKGTREYASVDSPAAETAPAQRATLGQAASGEGIRARPKASTWQAKPQMTWKPKQDSLD